jgi:hypothetical protein
MINLNASGSAALSGLKSKVGISLRQSGPSDFTPTEEENTHFALLFGFYHRLMESGYHAFATDDQLRGVAAKRMDASSLEVCAIKNFVVDREGKTDCFNQQQPQYTKHDKIIICHRARAADGRGPPLQVHASHAC